jgi:demethylmenaquinone methyltransferase/2-methoxy-6-polyprenyl-1,4-benzoquinol methylase
MKEIIQSRKTESYKIFNEIAPTYDFLNRLLSGGIDILWRKFLVKKIVGFSKPIHALDLATGTGDMAIMLSKQININRVVGLDMSEGMVAVGNKKVQSLNKNISQKIQLRQGDGVTIPVEDNSFDLVTLCFGIRNFNDPQLSLTNIKRVLKSNGKAMILEFSLPKNRLIKAFYLFYFRNMLPLIGNLFSGHSDAYTYLNKTVEDFPYGEEFIGLMTQAGFSKVVAYPLTFGIATLYVGEMDE